MIRRLWTLNKKVGGETSKQTTVCLILLPSLLTSKVAKTSWLTKRVRDDPEIAISRHAGTASPCSVVCQVVGKHHPSADTVLRIQPHPH